MVLPFPTVVVPMEKHTGVMLVVNFVSRVHPDVQLLLNFSHILSTSGVKICDVRAFSGTVTHSCYIVPGIMSHNVPFYPVTLLTIVRLPDMSLVAVAESFTILIVHVVFPIYKVTLVLPLSPSMFALGLTFRDPELGGKMSKVSETASFGNRPYVVSIKVTTTADILAVIRADNISSGDNSDE